MSNCKNYSLLYDWKDPEDSPKVKAGDLAKDERYCLNCGFIDKKKKFGTDGAGHGVCPICQSYQALAYNKWLPRYRLFRKSLGPKRYKKRCSRCGTTIINEYDQPEGGAHYLKDCDEVLAKSCQRCKLVFNDSTSHTREDCDLILEQTEEESNR